MAQRGQITQKFSKDSQSKKPTPGLDLAMQNSDLDDFNEPDTMTQHPWNSEDIWVRNQDDGLLVDVHQNCIL